MKGQFGMTFISSGTVGFYYFHKALYFLAPEKLCWLEWRRALLLPRIVTETTSSLGACGGENASPISNLQDFVFTPGYKNGTDELRKESGNETREGNKLDRNRDLVKDESEKNVLVQECRSESKLTW